MHPMIPCIWYDQNAMEAAELYASAFENSRIGQVTHYLENDASPSELPAGTVLTVRFTLCGQDFIVLNGGPVFRPNPAISFFVECASKAQFDALWGKLSAGGSVLMEVAEYPFSKRFGWLADKFGLSWQLSLTGAKHHPLSNVHRGGAWTGGGSDQLLYRAVQRCKAIGYPAVWQGFRFAGGYGDVRLLPIGGTALHGGGQRLSPRLHLQ